MFKDSGWKVGRKGEKDICPYCLTGDESKGMYGNQSIKNETYKRRNHEKNR